ncbi:hypothetical protein Tco_0202928 [Tanacetum coccineum]
MLTLAFSVRLEPIITVCSGCSGLIVTLTLSSFTLLTARGWSSGPETIAHSIGMILLLLSVSIPPVTGNFIIPCVVDGTACIFRNPGLPMKFQDWVRSFGISFASLSFAMTRSLESLEVSLFRKFRLSFSVGLSRYAIASRL